MTGSPNYIFTINEMFNLSNFSKIHNRRERMRIVCRINQCISSTVNIIQAWPKQILCHCFSQLKLNMLKIINSKIFKHFFMSKTSLFNRQVANNKTDCLQGLIFKQNMLCFVSIQLSTL